MSGKTHNNPTHAGTPRARDGSLSDEIRRQFGSAGVTRFLRSLPAFEVDQSMPQRFKNLLAELERVEADQRGLGAES